MMDYDQLVDDFLQYLIDTGRAEETEGEVDIFDEVDSDDFETALTEFSEDEGLSAWQAYRLLRAVERG